MTCTLLAIAHLVGHPVARGDLLDVPRWRVEQASIIELAQAKTCLRRLGIHWRIVGER